MWKNKTKPNKKTQIRNISKENLKKNPSDFVFKLDTYFETYFM